MAAADPVVNFGKVTVNTTYDASATSIVLVASDGAKLPDPGVSGAFNLVWWNASDYTDPADDPNREIVRCTARTSDTLTVTRGQESISATTKNTAGKTYRMIVAFTKKTYDDIFIAPTFSTSVTTPTVLATANDSGAIGSSGAAFSDFYLAAGGVINWNAGAATITESSGTVTTSGKVIHSYTNTSTSSTAATIRSISNTVMENPSASGQTYMGISFNGVLKSFWRFDYAGNINYGSGVGAYHAFYTASAALEDTFGMMITTTGVAIGQYANPPGGQLGVYNQSASRIGLFVKGTTSQSANLLSLVNVSGTEMFGVSPTGITTPAAVIRPKVVTVTDGAGAVIDASLGNVFDWTAAADRTAGTTTNPVNGVMIIIRFTASGGARTLTLPTASTGDFRYNTDITALTATTSGKTDHIGCLYNSAAGRWDVIAYTKGS